MKKTVFIFGLLTMILTSFSHTSQAGTRQSPKDVQAKICAYAEGVMAQRPGREEKTCRGFTGCTYVPSEVSEERCYAHDQTNNGHVTLCNYAQGQMYRDPRNARAICASFILCQYQRPTQSIDRCVPY